MIPAAKAPPSSRMTSTTTTAATKITITPTTRRPVNDRRDQDATIKPDDDQGAGEHGSGDDRGGGTRELRGAGEHGGGYEGGGAGKHSKLSNGDES